MTDFDILKRTCRSSMAKRDFDGLQYVFRHDKFCECLSERIVSALPKGKSYDECMKDTKCKKTMESVQNKAFQKDCNHLRQLTPEMLKAIGL